MSDKAKALELIEGVIMHNNYPDEVAAIKTIRKALEPVEGAPLQTKEQDYIRDLLKMVDRAVDVEGLKRSLVDNGIFMDSWDDCIDHSADPSKMVETKAYYAHEMSDHIREVTKMVDKPVDVDEVEKILRNEGWGDDLDKAQAKIDRAVDVGGILNDLYSDMDKAFNLGKNHDFGLCIDDTQIGIEFAFNWLCEQDHLQAQNMLTKSQNVNTSDKHVNGVDEKAISDAVFKFLDERALTADDHAKELMFHFGMYLQAQGLIGGGWQDISSAPKDGTEILLYAKGFGSILDTDATEFPYGKPPIPCLTWKIAGKHMYAYQGYYSPKGTETHWFSTNDFEFLKKPTHWQPLPTPPTEDKK